MLKNAASQEAEPTSARRRFMDNVARGAKRGASTGPAVALLLGASTKTALASGCGCGGGSSGAGLPTNGAVVDGIEAHYSPPDGSFEGELLNSGDDWDWITFTASAGDQISITLEEINGTTTGVPLADAELALYRDAAGGVPAAGDVVGTDLLLLDSGDLGISDFAIAADGTYIAAIAEGLDGSENNQGGYRATLSFVPEPGSATLLGTALAGLGLLWRRMMKQV